MRVTAQWIECMAEIGAAEWDALDSAGNPFLRHAFLATLESTGCVGVDTGWSPRHLLLRDDAGRLIGAVPAYEKHHSWGEFVFDWHWAQA
jgi:predicted N-acyltransferase